MYMHIHTIVCSTAFYIYVNLDLLTCIEWRMTPVATATFSELNVIGKSRLGGMDRNAVHFCLTPSLRPDPSLPTM